MYRTIVARLPDYALQRRAMPHIGTSMAAPPETDPTARSTRTRIATLEQARPIAPQQVHPARWSHRRRPTPHAASNSSRLSPHPQASPWPRNKKSAQTATFLRLAIVPNSPIANRGIKTQAIGRAAAYYHPAATKKEPLIAKKLQKCRDFCFCDGRSRRNGPNCRNGLNATGQTYRSNSTETGQWSEPMISE